MLQLVDQKRIGLDDPVGRYLPGVIPAGGTITIRELLQHRSGLANFTDYSSWMDQAEPSPSIRPIDVLRFAASKPLLFEPGSQWAYSNTNYIALGLVIEKVTGHPFGHELQQRILKPLALSRTELATTRRLPDLDDPGTNPNLPWAAGGIVSDTQDLARFFSALLSGHLVSRASLANMKETGAAAPARTAWASSPPACRAGSSGATGEASSTTGRSSMRAVTALASPSFPNAVLSGSRRMSLCCSARPRRAMPAKVLSGVCGDRLLWPARKTVGGTAMTCPAAGYGMAA